MKRKGFTLAEVLVSLGIIGVVAAMVSPTMNKIIPNKEKVNSDEETTVQDMP